MYIHVLCTGQSGHYKWLTPNKQVYYVRNKVCQTTKQTAGCLNCLSMMKMESDGHLTDFDPVTVILWYDMTWLLTIHAYYNAHSMGKKGWWNIILLTI